MTDEQYESLRRHILDLGVEIVELKMLVKQALKARAEGRESDADAYLAAISEIDMPDDIKKLLGRQN